MGSRVEGLILDAEPATQGGVRLVLATPNGLEEVRVEAQFRAYLRPLPGIPAEALARSAEQAGLRAWVEEWREPPWYDSATRILVTESPVLGEVERLARSLEMRGTARRVNTYPGPLVEALWRLGARPGAFARITPGAVEPLGEALGPGRLRVARLVALSWHGPSASPVDSPDRFLVECAGTRYEAGSPGEALDLARECRPHIVEARLEDRWHVPGLDRGPWLLHDPARSLVGPRGVLEWMRVSWLPWRETSTAPIGKVLTAAEAREAWRRKYLVDPRAPRAERFRTLRELTHADMAGAARIPEPGLYWGVVQLDYSSLYPSLISRHNLSAETVAHPTCAPTHACPAGHRVCTARRGLVAEVLGRLVERRRRLKREGHLEEQEALKWILVSGFGYLGYRNSLFGSISAYECVTSYARRALATAEEVAMRHGYRLVHSIVDSVFLKPEEPRLDPERLAREIGRRVGVPMRVEARYRWLYIPPTRKGTGAQNKYAGALERGGVKIKGLLAARRDTPPLIARAQRAALTILARARTPRELPRLAERAAYVLRRVEEALRSGSVDPRLLVIEKRLGEITTARRSPWRRVVEDSQIRPDVVRYVMTPRGLWPVCKGRPRNYNIDYYIDYLIQTISELPMFSGTDNIYVNAGNALIPSLY